MKRLIVAFFSLACVGALNAANCVWTGGADPADGKWSTPANWQDEVVPQEGDSVKLSGVGLVDGEITNDIANLTIAGLDFSGATPFRLVGEKLSIDGWDSVMKKTATVEVTNACDIACVTTAARFHMVNSGAGSFVLKGKFSGAVRLELQGGSWVVAGANEHTGGIKPQYAEVILGNPKAVGADGALYENTSNSTIWFSAPGEYHAAFGGYWTAFWFMKNGEYDFYGPVSNTMSGANFSLKDGSKVSSKTLRNIKIRFHEEFYAPKAYLYPTLHRNNQIHFLKKMSLAHLRGGYDDSECAVQCYFYAENDMPLLSPGRQNRIYCAAEEIFPGSTLSLSVSTSTTEGQEERAYFYLQGYDQTLVCVDNGGVYSTPGYERGYVTTPTGKPATLRLEPTADARTTALLEGPLSLTLAAEKATTVQAFSNRIHTTTGTLTVERGVLRFDGATTLAGVPKIVVGAEGEFQLDTTRANALAGLQTLSLDHDAKFTLSGTGATPLTAKQTSLVLSGSSEVTLPAGDYTFKTITVNGAPIAVGRHTGDAIPAQIKGATSITVVTGTTVTWTGAAGDGKWSTEANWQDGLRPQANNVVVLSGVGLVNGDITNDIENLTLSGLEFAGSNPFRLAGKALSINGYDFAMKKTATVAVTNACDIACVYGASDVFDISADGSGYFVLTGAFSGDVLLQLKNGNWILAGANTHQKGVRINPNHYANVVFSHPSAIGAAGATFYASTGESSFAAPGDYHANFVFNHALKFVVSGNYHIYGVVTNTISNSRVYVQGINDGQVWNPQNVKVYFHGEFYAPKAWYYSLMYGNNEIHFMKKATFAKTMGSNWQYKCATKNYFYEPNAIPILGPNRQQRIFCAGENVFPGALLRCDIDGSNAGGYHWVHAETGVFDLNGYDQTLARVDNGNTKYSYFGEGKEHGAITTPSGKPATLRIESEEPMSRTVSLLDGPLSITFAATNDTYVQVFSNRVHSLTGTLTAERGVLRFDGKTTIAGVQTIRVGEEGEFQLETSKANALAGLTTLTVADGGAFTVAAGATPLTAGQVDFVLGASATVTLPSGEYEVNTLVIDGGLIEPKTYTGAEIPANFKGVTSLTVKDYPTATWTGAAGDHLWSTAENWLGGIKPENDFYVILSNAGDDGEIVNDMGAMTLSKLTFTGSNPLCLTGDELAFRAAGACIVDTASAVITNAVVMNFPAGSSTVTASGGKAYYITGGLCGKGASVSLTRSNGSTFYLGGVGSVDAVTMNSSLNLISDTFLGEGATLTTSADGIVFYTGGDFRFNYAYTGTARDYLTFMRGNTNYNWHGSFTCASLSKSNWIYLLNARKSGSYALDGVTLNFYGPVDAGAGAIHGCFCGGIHFYDTLTAARLFGAAWGNDATGPAYLHVTNNLGQLTPGFSLNVVMRAPDALPGTVIGYDDSTGRATWIDLDGYDQTVDRIFSDAARLKSTTATIYSGMSGYSRQGKKESMPVTLTLKATDSAMAAVNIRDAVTVVLDATNTTYVQTFTNKTCATTGDLIVKKGVLKIAAGNSFAGVQRVVIGKEGKLVIDTNIASALAGVTNITVLAGGALEVAEGTSMPITAGTPSLTLETGASVTIPSSATYTFKWAEKDGVSLEKNVAYTSANLTELKAGTIVTQKRKPHSTGLIFFVR